MDNLLIVCGGGGGAGGGGAGWCRLFVKVMRRSTLCFFTSFSLPVKLLEKAGASS